MTMRYALYYPLAKKKKKSQSILNIGQNILQNRGSPILWVPPITPQSNPAVTGEGEHENAL